MFERFFPDTTVSSTYAIDYEKLYQEGYRGVLFDIDNTLVEHGKEATEQAKKLFSRLRSIGFECCLISNNKKKRVHSFNEKIGVHTVFNAHKPAKKGYYYAMELMNTRPENTVFVGDQLFTDIFGAKRIGLKNFLVKPINEKEEIQIVLKRKLENIVLKEYRIKKREEKKKEKMGKEMEERLFQSLEIDALLLTGTPNMRYAAGFTGEGYVYLSRGRRIVATDARYTLAARKECADCEVVDWKKEGYYDTLTALLQKDCVKRLGFEDSVMTVAFYNKMNRSFAEKGLRDLICVPVQEKVDFYRAVKTEEEQNRIRKAEAIGDTAFSRILEQLRPGMTEKQVAAFLEFYMKEAGADGLSFDTIAASGYHSAIPHAIPTDKKLQEGEFLTMDFGCRYQGYCSDMTRTVVIGRADARQKEIYEIVLRAQQTALAGIRPGMTGKEIDALARKVVEEAGYGKYFTHSLGHSLGLEIHECPNFSSREEQLIETGMVITVEPGIYIEGFGGVRIEDVAIITEDGCENITHSPKQLIEIEKEKERCR